MTRQLIIFFTGFLICFQPQYIGAEALKLPAFTSELNKNHSFVGKVWSTADKRFVSLNDLKKDIGKNQIVLVGEIHDNPDHHLVQSWVIEQHVTAGYQPDIVMEMVSSDKKDVLDNWFLSQGKTADKLRKTLNWDKSGWPSWSIYQPIVKSAVRHNLRISAGDADKKSIKNIGRKGFSVLPAGENERLGLKTKLPEALQTELQKDIVSAHCDMIPLKATGPMVNVQRFRDAVLADRVLSGMSREGKLSKSKKRGVVLIAGNGHVRKDRAVPWYMKKRGGQAPLTIMAREASKDLASVAQLAENTKINQMADYIVFTPKTERPDQCARFRAFLKKKKMKQQTKP